MELKNAVKNVMDQLSEVIDKMTESDFIKPVPILSNSTLGQHIRHTLEFFTCLIDGYESGYVNYDKRKHDTNIEQSKFLASSVINRILSFVDSDPKDKSFILETSYDLNGELSEKVNSTFFRELTYNIEHVVHHMAIIKIGIKAVCPEITIPEGFGVAVSTIKYQRERSLLSQS